MIAASPFDAMAADYDRSFTQSAIGRRLRAATWRWLDAAFTAGDRVLELNCGTGEDALHLARRGVRVLATDRSEAMLAATRAKIAGAGLAGQVDTALLALEDVGQAGAAAPGPFDGAFSNFGGLNCIGDLPGVARGLASVLRPGAAALFCVMGPAAVWEWGWFLARGKPRTAFRRLRRGGSAWRGMTIRYPAIGVLRRAFAPHFAFRGVCAIGALLPSGYAEQWAARYPRLLDRLDQLERRFETVPPLPWIADHYLIRFERQ